MKDGTSAQESLDLALKTVSEWMCSSESGVEHTALFDGVIDILIAAGVPLFRASASLMTMHPEVYGKQLLWRRGGKTEEILRPYSMIQSSLYLDNPVAVVRREGKTVRIQLERPDEELEYPLCVQLKSEGCTDYLILPVRFRSGACSFLSWTTDRPGGFSDRQIDLLESLVPVMALRMELEASNLALECLLETYLGKMAAERVLQGEFKRGAGQLISGVIWTCDLRGFTALADSRPIETVLALLDEYFECVADPFVAAGGEVLNISGDAVLGIFPFGDDEKATRMMALDAARDAFARAEAFNDLRAAKSRPTIHFGVCLHVGDVMLGNIGASGRLDFTIIGTAVNTACRLESLCKELQSPMLTTRAFLSQLEDVPVRALGPVNLRGIADPIDVFAFD
jgi:adenylate cyclase